MSNQNINCEDITFNEILVPDIWGSIHLTITLINFMLLIRLQRRVEVRCCSPAVNKEICSCDECSLRRHQQFYDIGNLIGRAGATCRTFGEHVLIEITAWTVELIDGERGDNDTGRDRIDTHPALAPRSPPDSTSRTHTCAISSV